MPANELEGVVRGELKEWFGSCIEEWRLLQPCVVENVLPQPVPPSPNPYTVSHHVSGNVFDCSDFTTMPSSQWALLAGKRGAQSVHEALAG